MTDNKSIQYREAAHLAGQTRYLPDLELYEGTLRGYPVSSPYAHARLLELDTSAVMAYPGVATVVTAGDIPGPNTMAPIIDDEPCLLPVGGVCGYAGHVVCLVAADTLETAKKAAALIRWKWEVLPPVLSVEEAMDKRSFLFKPLQLIRGEAGEAMKKAPFREKGSLQAGGQEHYYFETHSAYAVPRHQEDSLYAPPPKILRITSGLQPHYYSPKPPTLKFRRGASGVVSGQSRHRRTGVCLVHFAGMEDKSPFC